MTIISLLKVSNFLQAFCLNFNKNIFCRFFLKINFAWNYEKSLNFFVIILVGNVSLFANL